MYFLLHLILIASIFCLPTYREENGFGGSTSFDRDAEKVPLDDDDSLDYGDDDGGSKFNEDGSFIGQYGGESGKIDENASSIV